MIRAITECQLLAPALLLPPNLNGTNEARPVAITGGNSQIVAKVTDIAKRLGHTKSMATRFVSSYKDTKWVQEYMLRNTVLESDEAEMLALIEIEQDDFRIQALCNDNTTNALTAALFVQPQVARESKL
ncbi:hypothetical protein K438DRAFT_1769584 [Mycena galopus ATCC 62051]|nr:hypothetical protein K438DRAFT_1769584 [Mycena galopus ATCC 62051]